ncbi:type II toxin-antitoxin system prevent-host-death family antitoxin [soil metagenome]
MTQVNTHVAKTRLSELLKKVLNGEEVVIARAGKPIARLVPIKQEEDWFGMDEGKIWIADDFDTLPDDLMAAFYGEDDEDFD